MILTVTLNFALDVTYHTERFERSETARIETFARQAGGKGVNVARVLHGLGRDVAVTGLIGGLIGQAAREELTAAEIRDELMEIKDESRMTVMVVERDGQATGFSEPGPVVTAAEWQAFLRRFRALLPSASAVVIAGSVPRGLPADAYAQLIHAAAAADQPTLLDADGEYLKRGVEAGPTVVKVNRAELQAVAGGADDLVEAAREMRRAGAGTVVVSDGAAGLICVSDDDGVLCAAPPEPLIGNPTGAGDAASAGLVAGLLDGLPWPDRLANAAALSAASVRAPLAGWFEPEIYRRLRREIRTSRDGV